MIIKTRAIVLHAMKYGENGRVLKAMTEEEGMVPIFIRSVGSAKKGSITAYLEPMTRVELCHQRRPSGGMSALRELSPCSSTDLMNSSIYRSSVSIFMAEVAHGVLHEEEKDPRLFELLWNWVDTLNEGGKMGDIPIRFLLSLSFTLGFAPDSESEGPYFDLREGLFIERVPAHGDYLGQEYSTALRSYMEIEDLGIASKTLIKPYSKAILTKHLLQYFHIHLPGFREIKSHKILAQIMS